MPGRPRVRAGRPRPYRAPGRIWRRAGGAALIVLALGATVGILPAPDARLFLELAATTSVLPTLLA